MTGAMVHAGVQRSFAGSGITPVVVDGEWLRVDELGWAVVVLHAAWSGQSEACLRALTLLKADARYPSPWLYVVDIDSVSAEWMTRQFGRVSHGHGETYIVRGGEIVERRQAYAGRYADEWLRRIEFHVTELSGPPVDAGDTGHDRVVRALIAAMSSLSEQAYCAGWMADVEYALWARIVEGPRRYGQLDVTAEQLSKLRELSATCGGWVYWDEATCETFIPMAQWLEKYAQWRREAPRGADR